MEPNAVVKLAVDVYRGSVNTDFTNGKDAHAKLIEKLVAANGGSNKIDIKKIRDGECPKLFAILEETISVLVNEGLLGDEFFMNMVEQRNLALGDSNVFTADDNIMFNVADISAGTQALRRQRLTGGQSVTVQTQNRGIKIYEELNLLLSGRVNFNTFVERVSVSFRKRVLDDIYFAFNGMFADAPAYDVSGSSGASETEVLQIVEDIETDTDKTAFIVGTKSAIRKLGVGGIIEPSNKYKDDLYDMGYYGTFNGTPVVVVKNRRKVGSQDTIFSNDVIYVMAGDSKPIKLVNEGNPTVLMKDPMSNADLSQEFLYMEQYGIATMLTEAVGRYEFA